MRWALLGSQSICLPKARALYRETQAVCENKLISSNQFMGHLKQCLCTENSERLLRMLTDEKDGLGKSASTREGAVSAERCVEDWVVPLSWHNQIWQSEKEGAG